MRKLEWKKRIAGILTFVMVLLSMAQPFSDSFVYASEEIEALGDPAETHTLTIKLSDTKGVEIGTIPKTVTSGNTVSEKTIETWIKTSTFGNEGQCIIRGIFSDEAKSVQYDEDAPINTDTNIYVIITKYYTVTYKSEGQTVSSEKVNEGEYIQNKPIDPVWNKHKFLGWKEVSSDFDFGTPITKNTVLTAEWLQMYTLTFYIRLGLVRTVDVSENGVIPENEIPSDLYPGHNFNKWVIYGTENEWDPKKPVNKDTDIAAVWDDIYYTVSCNFKTEKDTRFVLSPGDEIYTFPEKVLHGSTLQNRDMPLSPQVTGFTFVEWYSDPKFGSRCVFPLPITDDTWLYAKWKVNEYKVTFQTYGGNPVAAQTIEYLRKATNPGIPTKTGYDFKGWFADAGFETPFDFDTEISENTVVYAKWKRHEYTVKIYDKDDNEIETQSVSFDDLAVKPAKPAPIDGYLFDDYFKEPARKNIYSFSSPVQSDLEIYEGWTRAYTVSFNSPEGLVKKSVVRENTLIGEEDRPSSDPSKEGYDFNGWYLENHEPYENKWDFAKDQVKGNTNLYAWLSRKKFTVSFATGSSQSISAQTIEYEGKVQKPEPDPERTGYTFTGWFDSNDSEWDFDSRIISQNEVIHAKWNKKSYTVSFNTMDAGITVSDQTVLFEDRLDWNKAYRTKGENNEFEIEGWYLDQTYLSKWNFDTGLVTDNFELYANWQWKRFTVAFDSRGGSAVASQTIIYGRNARVPASPKRTGYLFKGWKNQADDQDFDFSTSISENKNLYADWEPGPNCTINASAGKGGTISPYGKIMVLYESSKTFQFTADSGYEIKALYVDGKVTAFSGNSYTFNSITTNHTIEVEFEKIVIPHFTISANCGDGHGRVTPSSASVESGQDRTIRFIADDGYEVDYIILDGKRESVSVNYYFFTSVVSDHVLTVYFKKKKVEPIEPVIPPGYVQVKFMIDEKEYHSEVIAQGSTVKKPADPVKTGQLFRGWYDGSLKWDFSNPVKTDLTLRAGFLSNTVSPNDPHSGMDPVMNLSDPDHIIMVKGQIYDFGNGDWTSTDSTVLSIGKKSGTARAKNPSKVSVTLMNTNTFPYTTYKVQVLAPEMSEKKLTMGVGSSQQISLLYSTGLNVAWLSSNPRIVSVEDGFIQAKSKGSAKVTAYANGKAYNCSVTVKDTYTVPGSFDNVNSFTIRPTQTLNLKKISVAGQKPNTLDWRLADEDSTRSVDKSGWLAWDDGVIRVDVKGKLTAKTCGESVLIGRRGDARVKIIRVGVSTIPNKATTYINVGRNERLTYFKVNNSKAEWDATNLGEVVQLGRDKNTKGRVYGLNVGTSVVTCSYNGMSYRTIVHVENPTLSMNDPRIGKLGDNQYILTMRRGTRYMLSMPDVVQQVIWKTGNKKIAFVDEFGIVEARKTGNTVVSAKINGTAVKVRVYVTE